MTCPVSTVIRCANRHDLVYSTVESVEAQDLGRSQIILVTDPSTPAGAGQWLTSFAGTRGHRVVTAASSLPGAIRNTGIAATSEPYVVCLDAGDILDPSFHAACVAALDTDPQVELVATSVLILGPGSERRVVNPPGCALDDVLGDSTAVNSASLFSRHVWEALGGFDERLLCLEDYEFFLRLLHSGCQGTVVERPLLIRPLREGALYRRAWDTPDHTEAFQSIIERHKALFEDNPAKPLYPRERALHEIAAVYQPLLARHNATKRQIELLQHRKKELLRSRPVDQRETVDLADLRRVTPIASDWGYERGTPVDRYYIEQFLERHRDDFRGIVLEVQEADYTERYGANRVTRSDVLDLNTSNPRATVISDLRAAYNVPADTYDCVVLTQTLHVIHNIAAAVSECQRILKPGGVLLATLPCTSRVCREYGYAGDHWRVTQDAARELFAQAFPHEAIEVRGCGNVLVNTAFLYGLGSHELSEAEFEACDPYHPLLVTVRARKPLRSKREAEHRPGVSANRTLGAKSAILLYHRIAEPGSDVHGLSVPAATFREHARHLRYRYEVIPLSDLARAIREDRIPDHAVTLTFDDGYLDNYSTASPILAEFGLPATFFVTTEHLGSARGYEFWWDVLEDVLLQRPDLPTELRVDLPERRVTMATGSSDQRLKAYWEVYHAVSGTRADVRDAVIAEIVRWSSRDERQTGDHRRMRPDEIRILAGRPGFSIGAHSVQHLMLPLQPADVQREEAVSSKVTLETLLGTQRWTPSTGQLINVAKWNLLRYIPVKMRGAEDDQEETAQSFASL